MKKLMKYVLVLCVVSMSSLFASAAAPFFLGDLYPDNNSMTDPNNWFKLVGPDWLPFGSVPGLFDEPAAIIHHTVPVTAELCGDTHDFGTLNLGQWGIDGSIKVCDSGVLNAVVMNVHWSDGQTNNSLLTVDNGTVNVETMRVGIPAYAGSGEARVELKSGDINAVTITLGIWGAQEGWIDVYGGTLTVSGAIGLGDGGTVTIYGGVVEILGVEGLSLESFIAGKPVIDLRGGTLILEGDQINAGVSTAYPKFTDWTGVNIMQGFGDAANLIADYNVTNPGKTTITTIPGLYSCETPPAGDVNGDCVTDLVDVAELASGWLQCARMPITECP